MPTPRKKWFSVNCSIIDEPWPLQVKARFVNLCALVMERYFRDGADADELGELLLDPTALLRITDLSRPDHAVKALLEMVKTVSQGAQYADISAEPLPVGRRTHVRVTWPKFAEIQQLGSRPPGRMAGAMGADRAPYETKLNDSTSRERHGREEDQTRIHPKSQWNLERPERSAIGSWLEKHGYDSNPRIVAALLAKCQREWHAGEARNVAAVFQNWLKKHHESGDLGSLIALLNERQA